MASFETNNCFTTTAKKVKLLNLFRSDCSEIGFICLQTLKSKNQKGKLSISLRRYSILIWI
jgi:hypothetical protein